MNQIDPVQFGQLISTVEGLAEDVQTLRVEVRRLEDKMSTGKGIIIGLFFLAGAGLEYTHQFIAEVIKGIFK